MHVLNEGVVELTCRLFLYHCIVVIGLFTVKQFNEKISSFDFGHFNKDKPAIIQNNDLNEDKSLRQSAAQISVLAHTLPFIIGGWIYDTEDQDVIDRLDCFTLLLQIMNLCLAYEITDSSVDSLSRMIETFKICFNLLYRDRCIPNLHFLKHIAYYIRLFSPARQQWCFRFEAAHAYFKGLVAIIRNFKNMLATMSYRYQARICTRLFSGPGLSSKKFLYEGDYITSGPTVPVVNLPYAHLFDGLINNTKKNTFNIMRSTKIMIHGTSYCLKSIILFECDKESMLVFAEIDDICILNGKILVIVTLLQTIFYDCRVNGYLCQKTQNRQQKIVNIEDLIFPHSVTSFKLNNRQYIPLINHERCEFIG